MPILEAFCNAFQQAIITYENEMKGKIPEKRQASFSDLRQRLVDCQQPECHRILLLKAGETIPSGKAFDQSTIYLVPNQEMIEVHWNAHGEMKTESVMDKNKVDQLKAALVSGCVIEKSNQSDLFDAVTSCCGYTHEEIDPVDFRESMIAYVRTMPVSPLAALSKLFDSRLRKKLQAVLDEPRFSETRLGIEARKEMKGWQKRKEDEIKSLKHQMTELTEDLKREQAKDSVQKVNALTLELDREKKKTTFLTQENAQLRQSVDQLFGQCTTLKTDHEKLSQEKTKLQVDYDDLHKKYEALLQEKEKSSQGEKKQNTNFPFFNFT